jgi:hypothetical protein
MEAPDTGHGLTEFGLIVLGYPDMKILEYLGHIQVVGAFPDAFIAARTVLISPGQCV